jgi:ATP-binding cassette, subfamily B, bacterial
MGARDRPEGLRAVRTSLRLVGLLGTRDRVVLGLAAATMLGAAALKAVVPLLLGTFVAHALASGDGVRGILEEVPLLGGLVLGQLMLETARRQLVELVATAFERDSRTRAYGKLLHADIDVLRRSQTGAVYGRANRSIEGATKLLKLGAMDLLPAVVGSIAALAAAFAKDWRVALVMAGVVPFGFVLVRWQVRSQAGVRLDVRDQKELVDAKVPEAITIIESIRSTGGGDHILSRIGELCDELRRVEIRHHRAMSMFDALKSMNEAVWLVATLVVAAALRGSAPSAVGDVTAFLMLTLAVHTPLRELHRILDETAESAQLAGDLLGILDARDDPGYSAQANRALPGLAAGAPVLSVRDLRYSHHGRETPVLDGVDLDVRAGERIALVGASGCGKSTLLRVLRRLHHGARGEVVVDGRSLESLTHADLARLTGFVTQEPQVIRGTVAENIRFGLEVSDEQVHEAARRANVHDDILRMPGGYETVLEERGTSVSGGQKQRICIARALLREPRILLLDEPTSALDPENERGVQRTIDGLRDVAIIVVAHRLETLRNVDRVLVLKGGRVVEDGPFDELAAAGGHFAAMLSGTHEAAAA